MSDSYIVKVRKDNNCYLCGSAIKWGEKAWVYRHVERGIGWTSFYFHLPCWEYVQAHPKLDWECFLSGDISKQDVIDFLIEKAKAGIKK